MVHNEKFVVVLKCRGQILREKNGEVYLPFGENYTIHMENMNSKKVLVNVEIDGEKAASRLIIDANSKLDLERFIKNNLNRGRKFKFVQKTKENVNELGDDPRDGILRVEYTFETDVPEYSRKVFHTSHIDSWPIYHKPWWDRYPYDGYNYLNITFSVSADSRDILFEDINPNEGKTVKGEKSYQRFSYSSIGPLERNTHVITLQMRGIHCGSMLSVPITTKKKIKCQNCGKMNKSSFDFCPVCGIEVRVN